LLKSETHKDKTSRCATTERKQYRNVLYFMCVMPSSAN